MTAEEHIRELDDATLISVYRCLCCTENKSPKTINYLIEIARQEIERRGIDEPKFRGESGFVVTKSGVDFPEES